MGHEGFYNSFLVAMGNIVSALFMYALQAAWLCQRLIDQDYRQNHGSRLKPLTDCKYISEPIQIVSTQKRNNRKLDQSVDSPRKHNESTRKRGKFGGQRGKVTERRLNSSHPYLEGSDSLMTTFEYVNRLGQNLALRRAFSDINISSGFSEMRRFDNNQNYLSKGNVGETTTTTTTTISVADQDYFTRLLLTKGYVT